MDIKSDLNKILKQLPTSGIIGIDGPSCSGKTTLANRLGELFDAQVFRMDDYFLPQEKRNEDIAGNIDRARFIAEVFDGINSKRDFFTQRFDCGTQQLQPPQPHKTAKLYIVEGSYCLHPDFFDFYDFTVFITVDERLQRERIVDREAVERLPAFYEIWLPREAKYHKTFKVQEKCSLIV